MNKALLSTLVTASIYGSFAPVTQGQTQESPHNPTLSEKSSIEKEDIETIRVTGTNQSRYIIDAKDDATGLALSFLENPRNVTLIPEQLVLDRKITTLEEALRNAPGVSAGDGFGGTNDDFFMRGFRRNAVYRNGFKITSNFKANLSNTEYVQLVKGPAAITYGQVVPGGVVDVRTKQPMSKQRIAGEVRYGSFNDKFAMIDYSQPISEDLDIRVVASTQDAESFRDFSEIKRDTVAFSSRYFVSDTTQMNLAYEWRDESRPLDRGTIAIETSEGPQIINDLLDVPFSQRFGSPWEIAEIEYQIVEWGFKHEFNSNWNIETNVALEDSTGNDLQSRPRIAFVVDADTPINDQGYVTGAFDSAIITAGAIYDDPSDRVYLVKRLDGSRGRDIESTLANVKLRGNFEFAGMTHQVIIGADYIDNNTTRQFVIGAQTDGITAPFHSFIDPVYALSGDFSLEGVSVDSWNNEDKGYYANTFTNITDSFSLLAGIRYSDTEFIRESSSPSHTRASGITPQIGLTYRPFETVSFFASYAESFEPNAVVSNNTGAVKEIDPEEGEQVEFGVKTTLLNGKVQGSLTVYNIDKVNVVDGLDANGDVLFIDGRSSEGVELSVTGQPLSGMNISVSYAYTDAQDRDSAGATRQAESIADNILNLYASYEVQDGDFEGLGLGAGYYYESDRVMDAEGNLSSQLNLGDISLVDLSVWYTLPTSSMFGKSGNVRLQLAAKNVFDEEYYGAGFTVLRIPLGAPRTVIASLSFDF